MQHIFNLVFVQMAQKALKKSRGDYLQTTNSEDASDVLSDEEYATLLKEMDTFSAQFSPPGSSDTSTENLLDKNATPPGPLK